MMRQITRQKRLLHLQQSYAGVELTDVEAGLLAMLTPQVPVLHGWNGVEMHAYYNLKTTKDHPITGAEKIPGKLLGWQGKMRPLIRFSESDEKNLRRKLQEHCYPGLPKCAKLHFFIQEADRLEVAGEVFTSERWNRSDRNSWVLVGYVETMRNGDVETLLSAARVVRFFSFDMTLPETKDFPVLNMTDAEVKSGGLEVQERRKKAEERFAMQGRTKHVFAEVKFWKEDRIDLLWPRRDEDDSPLQRVWSSDVWYNNPINRWHDFIPVQRIFSRFVPAFDNFENVFRVCRLPERIDM